MYRFSRRSRRASMTAAIAAVTAGLFPIFSHFKDPADNPPTGGKSDGFTKLREEFDRLHDEATQALEAAAKEEREMKPEVTTEQTKRFTRMGQIKTLLEQQQKLVGIAFAKGEVTREQTMPGKEEMERVESAASKMFRKADGSFDLDSYKNQMNQYARTGQIPKELFTVSTATGSGAYLPKEVLQPVTIRRNYNAWRAAAIAFGGVPMTPTEMHAFSLPVADDSANSGQAQSQTSTSGTELDPTDASLSFTPNLYSSKQFWYSNTMVLGQSFDVLGFTLPMAQKRVEKQRETLWTASILASGTLGVTTASPITMTYDELLTWEHSLPVAYRADACFVLADSLFKVMRGIKDDQHRPIFDQDPTNTFQGRIHGKPVLVCDALSAVAANTVVGAFCSADALKILDIQNQRLARYSNLPTKPDQIGFELFENGDFQFIPNGMRLAKTAIS